MRRRLSWSNWSQINTDVWLFVHICFVLFEIDVNAKSVV